MNPSVTKSVFEDKKLPMNQNYKCVDCELYFHFNNDLRNHLQIKHDFLNEVEQLNFDKLSDFKDWLLEEQNRTSNEYSKMTGAKCKDSQEKVYYECIRSQKSQFSVKKIRQRKSQGSCKMSFYCTSQIVLKHNKISDECVVIYYKTHYQHDTDIQHTHISKCDRADIASKLVLGVPSKSSTLEYIIMVSTLSIYNNKMILNSVRDNIGNQLKRIDLLVSDDIKNIKKSYKIDIKDGCRHKDAATSVHMWITDCLNQKDINLILFYKQQGQNSFEGLKINDFCLIIMSNLQKEIIKKFGNKVIMIDGTHGLNPYDFELTSILVKDEFENGFPVAFMFSNRKDTFVFKLFFTKIKESVGVINASVFMSDITNTFYNAWCSIMGAVQHRLLCSWHVDRAWQSNLSKIRDLDKRSETYKMLKYLQFLTNVDEFENSISNFLLNLFNDLETVDFGRYFENNYYQISKEWAYCYRIGCNINTNMHLESFHRTLKYFYLDGKKVKRLDKSINQIMKYLRDKAVERIIKLKKGKSVAPKIVSRHRLAVSITFNMQQKHLNSWVLESPGHETYVVEKHSLTCCAIICPFCEICIHSYSCSCVDYLVKATICKHIHYVALRTSNKETKNETVLNQDTTKEIKFLTSELRSQNSNTSDMLKSQIKNKALEVINVLEKEDSFSQEQLKLMLENQKTVLALSTIGQCRIENQVGTNKEPANKNISKQKSFVSTKNKNKKVTKMSKPSLTEKNKVKELLTKNVLYISRDASNDHAYL